jgi:ABC-type transporter Mla MlaB component
VQAVAVPSRIDVDNALQVLGGLRDTTRGTPSGPLALDLSTLREFDSSALSLLLQLARERGGTGGRTAGSSESSAAGPSGISTMPLFLLNPPEKLQELADLYGVHEMLFGTGRAPGAQDRLDGHGSRAGQAVAKDIRGG